LESAAVSLFKAPENLLTIVANTTALIVAGIFWFYKYSQQSAGRKVEKDKRERIEESRTEKKAANRSRRAVNAPANG